MKKEETLSRELTELYQETKNGKILWTVAVQTTENNPIEEKPKETEDGVTWIVDECYVAYDCTYKGKDFHMITYEMIKTSEDKVATTNLVFLPDEGMRFFDLHTLLPHSVPASGILINQIHNLWELLIGMYKNDTESVRLSVAAGKLVIEDE